jgi:hypothetical protein
VTHASADGHDQNALFAHEGIPCDIRATLAKKGFKGLVKNNFPKSAGKQGRSLSCNNLVWPLLYSANEFDHTDSIQGSYFRPYP